MQILAIIALKVFTSIKCTLTVKACQARFSVYSQKRDEYSASNPQPEPPPRPQGVALSVRESLDSSILTSTTQKYIWAFLFFEQTIEEITMHTYKRIPHMRAFMSERIKYQEQYPDSNQVRQSDEPHPDYGKKDNPDVLAALRSEGETIRASLVNTVTIVPYGGTEVEATDSPAPGRQSVIDPEFTNRPA